MKVLFKEVSFRNWIIWASWNFNHESQKLQNFYQKFFQKFGITFLFKPLNFWVESGVASHLIWKL